MELEMKAREMSSASTDFTMTIYTVTSRSISARWSRYVGAHSYRFSATSNAAMGQPAFVIFNNRFVLGTVSSLLPATLYNVKVEVLDGNGNVLAEAQTQQLTAPDVPLNINAYSKTSSSITVNWSAIPKAAGYVLKAKAGSSIIQTIVNDSSGTLTGLQPYTLYTISVQSSNTGGNSQPSPPVETRTVLAAPVIHSFSPNFKTIMVNLEPVSQAVKYSFIIIRSDAVGNKIKKTITSTNVTFTDLEPGTWYTIKAHALDANGIPGDDKIKEQVTRPHAPQSVRAFLTSASMSTSLGCVVTWNASEGSTYYIAVPIGKSRNLVQNCTSRFTSCIISPIQCGIQHNVTVIAYNEAGASDASNPSEFTSVPCSPNDIKIQEIHSGNLTVSWAASPLTDYHTTFVKRDDGLEVMCNTSLRNCYFQSECGFIYFISVFSYNKVGQSPPGNVLNYTTAPCCPMQVKDLYVSSDTIEVKWNPARGAEMYETKAQDVSSVVFCNDTSTICTLSGLKCNTIYNITIYSYSDIRGFNYSCQKKSITTGPCSPSILNITKVNPSTINVLWQQNNRDAMYKVFAFGKAGVRSCNSSGYSCEITNLPCGATFSVSAVATSPEGKSLPSYSLPVETAPCCPNSFSVTQITQSMTNVSWTAAIGAQSYTTLLESSKGQAKCHTGETHCLLGCITCSTNYTVSLSAISETGLMSMCNYQGYSSSGCCPSAVKLYRLGSSALRVYWHATAGSVNYIVNITSDNGNFTCSPMSGYTYCDINEIYCGDIYTVIVSPVSIDGSMVTFCPMKMYSVSCSMNSGAMVIYRGKRSLFHNKA
ncbi:fibronectin type III domain-containing protein 7-like [Carcharodon carcharias]|uniref:fibronectin type III domain-containing protein 7-like n=1 Tax=Carcharodon carcharias TaxID=13397 RepID=UPI001B7F731D|nr:fibronectin type III domain-containing protein 7-like [Carcharodon carcharias]